MKGRITTDSVLGLTFDFWGRSIDWDGMVGVSVAGNKESPLVGRGGRGRGMTR